MTDRLSHKQTSVMLILMRLAREVSNPELADIAGFTLVSADRRRLNDLQFVSSRQGPRNCFMHELTDRGWAWCKEEIGQMSVPPPAAKSTLATALYIVLDGVNEHLVLRGFSLADFFSPRNAEAPAEVPADLAERIREAYWALAKAPKDWVRLVKLRPMLGGAGSDEVDEVLLELSGSGQARLAPESNRKVLTEADHDAAVRIGGEDNHLLAIEVS